jgi:hypothetical protein
MLLLGFVGDRKMTQIINSDEIVEILPAKL